MSNSNPGWYWGFIPTAGLWNYWFAVKQDWNNVLDLLIAQGGAPSFIPPGAWVPTDGSGASLSFSGISAEYTVIGNIVFASVQLTYPSTANSDPAVIGGLPYLVISKGYAAMPEIGYVVGEAAVCVLPLQGGTTAGLYALSSGAQVLNSTMSGKTISFQLAYPLS